MLWSQARGLTAGEINTLAKNKTWKEASIHLILNRMLDRSLIVVDGMFKSGKTYGRTFKAAITPEEYSLMQIKQNALFFKDKHTSITNLCASLIDSDEINIETINKIEELLRKKKEEL